MPSYKPPRQAPPKSTHGNAWSTQLPLPLPQQKQSTAFGQLPPKQFPMKIKAIVGGGQQGGAVGPAVSHDEAAQMRAANRIIPATDSAFAPVTAGKLAVWGIGAYVATRLVFG